MYKVYVKVNNGVVVEINSDAFISDLTDWFEIDSGEGDKYHHAQGNYLDGPLLTREGVCRYKLVEGKVQERAAEEIQCLPLCVTFAPSP